MALDRNGLFLIQSANQAEGSVANALGVKFFDKTLDGSGDGSVVTGFTYVTDVFNSLVGGTKGASELAWTQSAGTLTLKGDNNAVHRLMVIGLIAAQD